MEVEEALVLREEKATVDVAAATAAAAAAAAVAADSSCTSGGAFGDASRGAPRAGVTLLACLIHIKIIARSLPIPSLWVSSGMG